MTEAIVYQTTTTTAEGEVGWRFVQDDDAPPAIELAVVRTDGTVRSARVPDRWRYNFGGSDLAVAPDGSHAALHLYSGQGDGETLVFRLVPEVALRASLPIAFSSVVSPDALFVAGLAPGRGFAIEDPDAEWWELPQDAPPVFELARLEVLDLSTGVQGTQLVHVTFPELETVAGTDEALEEWTYENLEYPELELGTGGQGVVATRVGRFGFTLPCAAPSGVLAATWSATGGDAVTYPLTDRGPTG